MSNLVYFEDHYPVAAREPDAGLFARRRLRGESLIPLQLALGENDIETCFARLAHFGHCPVFPRANPVDAGKILFLVRIRDAVALNKSLLETVDETEQAAADRIDLIQMLENCEESLLSRAWDRIGRADSADADIEIEATATKTSCAAPAPTR